MIGLEAGQSAFGDVYAWLRDLILESFEMIIDWSEILSSDQKKVFHKEIRNCLLEILSKKAAGLKVCETDIIALDWLNGRRTPDANQFLKGAIQGLDLGSDAVQIFKALVESTCFGARAIVERFESEGIEIQGVIGLGGVAKKSPYVMQTLANVLNMPIKIAKSDHVCARGAAMFAATAAGVFENIAVASEAMGNGFGSIYKPEQEKVPVYDVLYQRYRTFGASIEKQTLAQVKKDIS
jgi:L-ribulokinase